MLVICFAHKSPKLETSSASLKRTHWKPTTTARVNGHTNLVNNEMPIPEKQGILINSAGLIFGECHFFTTLYRLSSLMVFF
jgi:hypothetical protein